MGETVQSVELRDAGVGFLVWVPGVAIGVYGVWLRDSVLQLRVANEGLHICDERGGWKVQATPPQKAADQCGEWMPHKGKKRPNLMKPKSVGDRRKIMKESTLTLREHEEPHLRARARGHHSSACPPRPGPGLGLRS